MYDADITLTTIHDALFQVGMDITEWAQGIASEWEEFSLSIPLDGSRTPAEVLRLVRDGVARCFNYPLVSVMDMNNALEIAHENTL